jgi:hypothetical protein
MKGIEFPANTGQRYYESHYKFFLTMARAAGMKVTVKRLPEDGRGFWFRYKGIKILVDFGDHRTIGQNIKNYPIIFRYHFSPRIHNKIENCYPLTPISFYDWDKFNLLKRYIAYRANNHRILNNQKPGAAAEKRRRFVQARLIKEYGGWLDTSITSKEIFWKKINECLVSVCVPGARNDILDRGQFQYMAFGACTISPPLDVTLPFWRRPVPNIHYLACRPDYLDLKDRIEWCRENRERCVIIGQNAKILFHETSTPEKVWAWINNCIEGGYNGKATQRVN